MWRHHLPELYEFLRKCNVFDRQEADEILAAARMRVIKGYEPQPGHTIDYFKGYLKRTGKAVIADRKRRFGSKFIRCSEEILEALSARSTSSPSQLHRMIEIEQRADKRRLIARLRTCLPLLRLSQQTILELRYLQEGHQAPTFKEIGEKLGISNDAARKRHDRALERLTELLLEAG